MGFLCPNASPSVLRCIGFRICQPPTLWKMWASHHQCRYEGAPARGKDGKYVGQFSKACRRWQNWPNIMHSLDVSLLLELPTKLLRLRKLQGGTPPNKEPHPPAQPLTVHSLQCCSLQTAGPDPRLPLQTLDTDPADSRLELNTIHRFHNHHKGWVHYQVYLSSMNSHFGSPGYLLARAFCMNFSPIYILKPQTCLRLTLMCLLLPSSL